MAAIDILEKIEDCRNDMVMLAMQTSFSDQKVVEMSVKLDQLLNQLEQLK
ncbi:aspartyl-phosphate phosphatase Spo0E family protein [Bacillus sp. B190/17]|uniref:Aspartyl-phosphate phosphatase Spo0E family protein n=1 Tax=Bacillus lumedeiriae TaxID=3058829 RepID=A0ABW8IC40_9BACI